MWNSLHEQRITLVHATERHIRSLTEETQAETDKVEKMRKEQRQEGARVEQLRLEVARMEDAKQQAEQQQRVCYEQLRRLAKEKSETARKIASERLPIDPHQMQQPSKF